MIKKLDILIMIITLIIPISSLIVYFSIVDTSFDTTINIEYNNKLVYQFDVDDVSYAMIYVSSSLDTVNVEINQDGNVYKKSYENIEVIREINYMIVIADGEVNVLDSLCKNHYCMHMTLNKTVKSPIICTDGLVIKYKNNLSFDIITGE